MTNQEKKKVLQKYRNLNFEIERLKQEITQWESFSQKITPTYSTQPKGSNSTNKIELAVENIDKLTKKLCDVLIVKTQLRIQIYQAIFMLHDSTLKLLMEYKYIDGLTFEQIAVKLNYSYVHICRLHGEALEKITL